MENNAKDIYDALAFFQSLSVCIGCKYWKTSFCSPSIEDGMCSKKAKALDIIWNTIKEKPNETIISLSN